MIIMPSPLFNQLNNNPMLNLVGQFKSNPMALLTKRFNLPGNISDPNEIINHLLRTGQVSQAQINRAMQMGNNPNIRDLLK